MCSLHTWCSGYNWAGASARAVFLCANVTLRHVVLLACGYHCLPSWKKSVNLLLGETWQAEHHLGAHELQVFSRRVSGHV